MVLHPELKRYENFNWDLVNAGQYNVDQAVLGNKKCKWMFYGSLYLCLLGMLMTAWYSYFNYIHGYYIAEAFFWGTIAMLAYFIAYNIHGF